MEPAKAEVQMVGIGLLSSQFMLQKAIVMHIEFMALLDWNNHRRRENWEAYCYGRETSYFIRHHINRPSEQLAIDIRKALGSAAAS